MWREKFKLVLDHLTAELVTFLGVSLIVFVRGWRKKFHGTKVTLNKEDSMEKEVAIGTEAKVEVKLASGKMYLVAKYDGVDADAEVSVGIEVDLLLDKLAEKVPGKIDDAVIQILKAALKVI